MHKRVSRPTRFLALRLLFQFLAFLLCLGAPANAAPQASKSRKSPDSQGSHSQLAQNGSESPRGGAVAPLTGSDILRLLDIGLPPEVIIERIRANECNFTGLDDLFSKIHQRDTENSPRLLLLIQEISAATYRHGKPLQAPAADQPARASIESTSGAKDPIEDTTERTSVDPSKAILAAPTSLAPRQVSVVPSAAPSLKPFAEASASTPLASDPPAAATDATDQTCDGTALRMVTKEEIEKTFPSTPEWLKEYLKDDDYQRYKAEYEAQRSSAIAHRFISQSDNPCLRIKPLRFVFDKTEVGQQSSKDIEITNTGTNPIIIMSIRLSLIGPNRRTPPVAFELTQPDLQCPALLRGRDYCDLKVLFHPLREEHSLAYVNIITQNVSDPSHTPYYDIAYLEGDSYVKDVVRLNGAGPLGSQPGLRSVMGFDISGASNAQTQQKFFLEFDINAPIGSAHRKPLTCKDAEVLDAKLISKIFPQCNGVLDEPSAEKTKKTKKEPENTDATGVTEPSTEKPKKPKKEIENTKVTGVTCKDARFLFECAGRSDDTLVRLWKERRDPLNRPFWFFINPRITSVPQPATSLGSLNVSSLSTAITSKSTDIIQGFAAQGGVEAFFIKPRRGLPTWSVVPNAKARTGVAFVFGLGFTSPFSPPDKNTQEFTINSTILAQFPNAANQQKDPVTGASVTPTIIALLNRDRSRFFRQYYTGFRFKTYFFSDRARGECDNPLMGDTCEGVVSLFPGIVDVTAGQDEGVTAGHLADWVFRLESVYPLPFAPEFHIFGTVNSAFAKNRVTNPLVLDPPSAPLALSDPHVFIQPLDLPNRDTYRIGVGVDLLQVWKRFSKQSPPTSTPTAEPGTPAPPKDTPPVAGPAQPAPTSPPAPKP